MAIQAVKPVPGVKVPKPVEEPKRIITITSFGYDFGTPDDVVEHYKAGFKPAPWSFNHYGRWVYDTRRDLRNPWVVAELKKLNGTHPEIQAFFEDCPHAAKRLQQLYNQVSAYLGLFQTHIWIGCKRGKHRSVAVAELLRKIFGDNGFTDEGSIYSITVVHRDIDKVYLKPTKAATS